MIRLLIVDDHPLVREALARVLSAPGTNVEVVAAAASGQEAVLLLERLEVEVVLLDVSMPGMNGLEVTCYLQVHFPRVKVLLLTLLGHPALLETALEAGAKGYLLKTAGKKELLTGVRAIAEGQAYFSPEVARWLRERGTTNGHAAPAHPPGSRRTGGTVPDEPGIGAARWPFPVSERERCLLRRLARGHSPRQIEEELLMSRPTQERYLAQLLEKTGTTGINTLLAWLQRKGLLDASDPP